MRGRIGLWLLALLVTLSSAVYQRLTGPTRPARGTVALGGAEVKLRLLRSWAGEGDLAVRVAAPDPRVTGSVAWRRYPTNDTFSILPMAREGETLTAALPHQPPAGKVEYQVRLEREGASVLFPERPAIARFKGAVSNVVIVPHVFAMFTGMLVANAAGFLALRGEKNLLRICLVVVALLSIGGLFLGPLVQKQAFGAYWTGWPFGTDLTFGADLLPVAFLSLAGIGILSSLLANIPVVAAALVMITGYLVAAQAVPEIALAPGFVNWPNVTLPVFVAMMFGGTLGGNATLIGASANIVSAGVCAAEGRRITFLQFMRIGLPVALAQLAVGALYVVLVLPRLG